MRRSLVRITVGIIPMVFLAAALALPLTAYAQSDSRLGLGLTERPALQPKSSAVVQPSGIQIQVQCGNPAARVKSIADGLKLVANLPPAVLLISGTCHEDVVIQGLNNITLQGNPTATIDGGIDPNVSTVAITGSLNISFDHLTITGGGEGVTCFGISYCLLSQVTVQNSLGAGAGVGAGSRLEISDSIIQNNADVGLGVNGIGAFFGGVISGNGSDGVVMRNGGFFATGPGNLIPDVAIRNNAGNGIRTTLHNSIVLDSAMIAANALNGVSLQTGSAMGASSSSINNNIKDGVALQTGSELNLFASTITHNGGHQIRIGDLSIARFVGFQSNTISGPNAPDVVCDPQFSATRQLAANAVGATTNCPAELPPTP